MTKENEPPKDPDKKWRPFMVRNGALSLEKWRYFIKRNGAPEIQGKNTVFDTKEKNLYMSKVIYRVRGKTMCCSAKQILLLGEGVYFAPLGYYSS